MTKVCAAIMDLQAGVGVEGFTAAIRCQEYGYDRGPSSH
jgi:hypothetical protein